MLKQITCDAFNKENQTFSFRAGLNVILGDGTNSIGKTSLLKIIDYVYGGKYYMESNEDVIQQVGHHDIDFVMQFSDETRYYKRGTRKPSIVYECNKNFMPEIEINITDYCTYLRSKLISDIADMSFRKCVGLYSRIWNKANKEVNKPLFLYSGQHTSEAIIDLIKLFKKYDEIGNVLIQRNMIVNIEKTYNAAKKYSIIEGIKTKSELIHYKRRVEEINHALNKLNTTINLFEQDIEYQVILDSANLFSQRAFLLKSLSATKRKLKRINDNIDYNNAIHGVESKTFEQLKEFFSDINMDKLHSISNFHEQLGNILRTELNAASSDAKKDIKDLENQLSSINDTLENAQISNDNHRVALSDMAKLIQEKTHIEDLLIQYHKQMDLKAQKKRNNDDYNEVVLQNAKQIEPLINEQLKVFASQIESENNKAPVLELNASNYSYSVKDNTGTGKAFTDLLLFDLSVFKLTELPIMIHDSFLFNNIDSETIGSFIKIYNSISTSKQSFISIDRLYDFDEDIREIIESTTSGFLYTTKQLYCKDWRSL